MDSWLSPAAFRYLFVGLSPTDNGTPSKSTTTSSMLTRPATVFLIEFCAEEHNRSCCIRGLRKWATLCFVRGQLMHRSGPMLLQNDGMDLPWFDLVVVHGTGHPSTYNAALLFGTVLPSCWSSRWLLLKHTIHCDECYRSQTYQALLSLL